MPRIAEDAPVLQSFTGEPGDVVLRATRPQSLIITIYGAYSRRLGGWLPVAALLNLLGQVGVEDAAVRSALSRIKRRGVLIAERRSGVAGYALSESAWRTFDIGDARVLNRRHPPPNEGWVLAAFSIPESARDLRYRLRSRLSRVGFAQVSGGLWIAPRTLEQDIRYVAEVLGVQHYLDVFRAEHIAFRPTVDAVRQWWDLDAMAGAYEGFAEAYGRLGSQVTSSARPVTTERAFADYTRVLTSWRPLPYLDPGLPREYLPKRWPGDRATALFYALHDELAHLAQTHVNAQLPEA